MFTRSKAQGGSATGKFSFIGAEVCVTGDISTPGELHIDGTVTGDVRCGALTQGPTGAIHGNIVAEEVRLAGLVDGAVEAGALSFEASARVTGDVVYETLGIATGAQIEGRLKRRKTDAISTARSDAVKAKKEGKGEPPAPLFAPAAQAAE
jgi:cytoskeletal protein CcmA (bactofilin family)